MYHHAPLCLPYGPGKLLLLMLSPTTASCVVRLPFLTRLAQLKGNLYISMNLSTPSHSPVPVLSVVVSHLLCGSRARGCVCSSSRLWPHTRPQLLPGGLLPLHAVVVCLPRFLCHSIQFNYPVWVWSSWPAPAGSI